MEGTEENRCLYDSFNYIKMKNFYVKMHNKENWKTADRYGKGHTVYRKGKIAIFNV